MKEVLLITKRKISVRYLGRYGILGVGAWETDNTICIYVENKTRFLNRGFDQLIRGTINNDKIGLNIEECAHAIFKS